MLPKKRTVLILDDDPNIASSIARLIRLGAKDKESWDIHKFTNAYEALHFFETCPVSLVISDYMMPKMNGLEFLSLVKNIQPECGKIIISGNFDLPTVVEAVNKIGIDKIIPKPWTDFVLLDAILSTIKNREILERYYLILEKVEELGSDVLKEELEKLQLEELEPGITQVNWGPDGSIII